MRLHSIIFLFLIISPNCWGQTYRTKTYYSNGAVYSKGKSLKCPDFNPKNPCYRESCRKIGQWKFYYQQGGIERIANYKKISNCNSVEIPHGLWTYFDKTGNIAKEEEYKEGKLWRADVMGIYQDTLPTANIRIRNGIRDTVYYETLIHEDSLIKNNDFKLYFNKPEIQFSKGQQSIEQQVPFWFTPNKSTPDYYNPYRRLVKVPDNYQHLYNSSFHYVGVILYHHPTGNYSEYISTQLTNALKKGKTYCIKLRLRLSDNSGYYINKLGIHFSASKPEFTENVPISSPQVVLLLDSVNRNNWAILCSYYKAKGNENYLSVGRFFSLSDLAIQKINPKNFSEGDLNESAYYLIDRINILEDSSLCNCTKETFKYEFEERTDFEEFYQFDTNLLKKTKVFTLNKVYFEFDKYELLPESDLELNVLFELLLKSNASITILGHTDNVGTDEYNQELSVQRAKAVQHWLINKGIHPSRLKYKGYGAAYPIVANDSEINRAINRRVEFMVN